MRRPSPQTPWRRRTRRPLDGVVIPSGPTRPAVIGAAAALAAVWAAAGAFRLLRPAPGPVDLWWDSVAGTATTSALHVVATIFAVAGTGFPAIAVALVLAVFLGAARGWIWSAFVLGASVVSETDVLAMKWLAGRSRPDAAFGAATAFPSGHAANAALLGGVVILLTRRLAVRILAVAGMLAMAWSRTAIHAHWLSDVAAGLAVGAATAVLLLALFRALLVRRLDAPVSIRPDAR